MFSPVASVPQAIPQQVNHPLVVAPVVAGGIPDMAEAYMADMMAAAKERQANKVNEVFIEFQATDATMTS